MHLGAGKYRRGGSILELALRKNLSDEKILDEMRKIREFERDLIKIAKDDE